MRQGYPKINQAIDNANESLKPVGSERIAAGAITNSKIADGAVNGAKLTKYAVSTDNIATESVTNAKLAPGSVSNSKIADGAVANPQLADKSVSNAKLTDGSVSENKLTDFAVGYKKMAVSSRGLGINTGILYPMQFIKINGNALPDPTPNSNHLNVIQDVKIHGALSHKVYAIESVYMGFSVQGSERYGATFGCFDRKEDGTVDASTYKRVLDFDEMSDSTVPVNGIVTKLYKSKKFNLIFEITYNTDITNVNRLAFIAGTNFYEAVIHDSCLNFRNEPPYKVINILGDSLSALTGHASKPYHSWIGDWLGAKINNYGISGSTVGNKYDPMSERYLVMDPFADVILVYGGTNDFGRDQPLGTMADRTNETFYGAMHVLLSGLYKKYPGKKIGFVSMHHFGTDFFKEINSLGLTKLDYVKATREVCEYYSIPLLDLYRSGGFNFDISEQKTLYSVDSLHFNNNGHERLAKLVYDFIIKL
ncbi:SGNH/GDSL hydrolase family protein [Bacillus anthracis]|uniref:SGNH/GDSL hydrolase family protein n=1 Tax=Bacillus anthracis TaxID=1392 RepID=UPI0013C37448|nr:SGNH/GDSL hydrolase family protein [Bacillus anthracis]